MILHKVTKLQGAKYHFRSISSLPYESIPGPRGKGWPIIGHLSQVIKKPAGFTKSWENFQDMKNKYLQDNDKLMRLHLPAYNPINGNFVLLFEA